MSVKSFGRAFRSRRPSVHDICHSSLASTTAIPRAPACGCQLRLDTDNGSSISSSGVISSRQFSTSSQLSASKQQIREQKIAKTPLPDFPKTSNQPLDNLLHSLHRDQFLIDHLPDHYRRLIVRTKRHHVLADQAAQQAFARGTNPSTATLTITLDGQTLPLRPIKQRTLYGSKSLTAALNMMKSPAEYDVLPQLVQAMAFSKIRIEPGQWKKLIRMCGLIGRPGVAIRIANDGIVHRRNGFVYTLASLREMIRAQFVRFLLPDEKDAVKAVHRARGVVNLARRWKEQYDEVKEKKRVDDRAPAWLAVDPVVRGSVLFLQAGKVLRWNDGKDVAEEGKEMSTLSDVKALMGCWEAAQEEVKAIDTELDSYEKRLSEAGKETVEPDYAVAREAVKDWEPVLQALEWTQTVLHKSEVKDVEVERWMPSASRLLSESIAKWKPIASKKGKGERIGMQIYEGAYEALDGWYTKDIDSKPADVVKDKISLE
ncbi:hypothetical protein H072_8562 [Dactylellina haptotyla CBS 200.50]|uniref:Uncharacterized protein n=1 Tax=Dactylellina haptotyla (strain CBS 200.50) TaxID=1284197 RepID=S8A4M1_DACHA|nr:hypothetical protein H072_8562 [Dactylellina haptotyla CBS 200.50]